MHRCQYNKTWSSQGNIPAGNLNWSQREDNVDDIITIPNNGSNKQIIMFQNIFFINQFEYNLNLLK